MLDFLPIQNQKFYMAMGFYLVIMLVVANVGQKYPELGLTNALYLGLVINIVLWNTVGKKYVGMY